MSDIQRNIVYVVRNRDDGALVCIHATAEGAVETIKAGQVDRYYGAWEILP